jgi:type II secretory ATPase GspE/PulE/Tfp pilus assembly ATPase PilB-like protein
MASTDSKNKQLQETLSELKHKEEENRAKQLAEKLGLPYINLTITPISPNDLTIIPKEKAQKGNLLVIKKTGRILHLAIKNPEHPQAKEIIKELQKQGFECQLFITSSTSLKKGWQQYDLTISPQKETSIRGVFVIQKEEMEKFKKSLQTIQDLQKTISDLSTSQLLTIILAGSIKMKASDIHLEPSKEEIRLRYRIDGLLQDIATFPIKEYHFLVSRIKTLSDMLLNVTDVSQDGRFAAKISGARDTAETIDLRVSILPTNYGESVVMRLLGMSTVKLNLDGLGIRPELFKVIKSQIDRPNGMILTTGPTGSGKTTTLYACLNYVNKPGTKIITVEDPIEYRLTGITQTPISHRKGHTFAKALRAIVRQDPDVLMIGEIRDQESAEIAVEFALTGHIVFSTIHTNEAAGAIPRLFGMKITPDSLASSLNLIMAQRLVRKLCPDCKEQYQASPETIKVFEKIFSLISPKSGLKIPKKISTLYRAKGCSECHGLGYQGRIGVFEFLTVNEPVKKLILDKAAAFEIQNKAQEEGMITLMQDALLRGMTSLEEIERIVGSPQLVAEQTKTPS